MKNQSRPKYYLAVVLVLFLALLLSACSMFEKKLPNISVDEIYRHDLKVQINGVTYNGVGVVEAAPEYTVKVFPKGKIDRLMWRMCDGEDVLDDLGDDDFTFKIKPTQLETKSTCGTLQITVLEEKKRRNGYALIVFKDTRPEMSLPAELTCNKVTSQPNGVSVCQSAEGLYSQIKFSEPVVQMGAEAGCDVIRPNKGDETTFLFSLPKDECNFFFVAQSRAKENGKRKVHYLTTLGYTDVLPEEK